MTNRGDISILVVDDSPTMLGVLKEMLSRLGYLDIDLAESGPDALKKIGAKRYSVIISDWHMEPINGPELLKRVQTLRTKESYRSILITTDGSWGTRADARMSGADAFLVKPFLPEALGRELTTILPH